MYYYNKMRLVGIQILIFPYLLLINSSNGAEQSSELAGTELYHAYVVFRHGDRTPQPKEVKLYPKGPQEVDYAPYGIQALTDAGKLRSYQLGKALRSRYDGFVDRIYRPEELAVNATDRARTQMTALAVLAGMYPLAAPAQWLPGLAWQPIPYLIHPTEGRDHEVCPRHAQVWSEIRNSANIQDHLKQYQDFFKNISEHTGYNISTPTNIRNLKEGILSQNNYGIPLPAWFNDSRKLIDELAVFELASYYSNDELARLADGAQLDEFLKVADKVVFGGRAAPRLQLFSAHEVTLAGTMAAARVFRPHIPRYSSAFALELRKNTTTGEFGVAAVYMPSPGEPASVLPVRGCGGAPLCDYRRFTQLTEDTRIARDDIVEACKVK